MSFISSVMPADRTLLSNALRNAILVSIKEGKNEPATVAQLTYRIPNYVNDLNIVVDGYSLTAGGVFIHQTPKVTFGGIVDQKSIEIGDLLVIHTAIIGEDVTRKAILYQAKMFDELPVKPDNQNQLKLYRDWPKFTYVNSGILSNRKREVIGLDLHSSAKYLLLDKCKHKPIWPKDWWHLKIGNKLALTAHPNFPLSNHESFLKEMYHFVLGDAGKCFSTYLNREKVKAEEEKEILLKYTGIKKPVSYEHRGWEAVINDLLEVTADKTTSFMNNASGGSKSKQGKNPTRGCHVFGNQLSFITEYNTDYCHRITTDNNLPPIEIPPRIDDNEGDGISVIEFVLRKVEPQETRSK